MAQQQPPQRPPAPSLFVGPPAQHTPGHSIQHEPARQAAPTYDSSNGSSTAAFSSSRDVKAAVAKKNAETNTSLTQPSKSILKAADQPAVQASQTQAAWAEMQNTLEEVELGAAGGANAFGAEHARALEDLRKAQIALAQAWTRSEADDEAGDRFYGADGLDQESEADGASGARGKMSSGSVLSGRKKSTDPSEQDKGDRTRARSGTDTSTGGAYLEEETERDIMLARKRRQANDRYFERVNRGVLDVVEKLETVAQKLKDVETEAQEIWEDESIGSDST